MQYVQKIAETRNYFFFLLFIVQILKAQKANNNISVIAYYSGSASNLDKFDVQKLTHIIYSFCHLKGNELAVDNAQGSATIKKMVALKEKNPQLKVIISLGGWGGCKTCSEVFSSDADRDAFATSVKMLLEKYNADGIDLDWEYPAILGFPGHRFVQEDRENFTQLIQQLRTTLGEKYEISFAAGGFKNYFDSSVEWNKVMPLVNRVNLMSYDLVNGYATVTGHHTPLYSTPQQQLSVDYGVRYLESLGVPSNKITIGAAFYARIFESGDSVNNGLYQSAKFKESIGYNKISSSLNEAKGYTYHWDSVSKAPYLYNAEKKLFATYDDATSIRLKTQYAIDNNLDGIMFWELSIDKPTNGLLDVIYKTKQAAMKQQQDKNEQ